MPTTEELRKVIVEATKKLADEGKVIEMGWVAFLVMTVPENASEAQKKDLRRAYFAGAQHLWGSIMLFLESGAEATPADLRRMDQINAELNEFVDELKREMT